MGVAHCERVFLFLICKRIQILSVHNLEHPGPIIHGDLRSVRLQPLFLLTRHFLSLALKLNVLIHDGHVKLADFGLSHIPNADKGLTSKLRGNGRWLAPEIKEAIRNKTEYELTKESDMFSFGHVFLEVFCGLSYPRWPISDNLLNRRSLVIIRLKISQIPMNSMMYAQMSTINSLNMLVLFWMYTGGLCLSAGAKAVTDLRQRKQWSF